MAGLIDFSLLGPGIDLSGATEGYINSLQAATDRKLQKAQLDRQTRLDLRADKQDAARQTAGGQIAAGDLTGAGTTALQSGDTELYSQIQGLSKEHRAEIAAHADIIGSTALALKAVPTEQRAAAFAAAAPALKARGLTDEELATAGGDLSDQALDGHINSTLTVKDALQKVDNDRKAALERDRFGHTVENDASMRALTARGQDITVRGQDRAAADAAAGRAVTMRGQNLTAASGGAGGGKAPSGYRFRPDGTLEPIPGGPAGGGAALTEAQGKGTGYYRVASEAARTLNNIKGYNPSIVASALDKGDVAGTSLGETDRRALNAQRAFVVAALRSESGATYGASEVADKNRVLFPVPGDTPTVLADKARLRGQYLAALRATSGPGAKGLPFVRPDSTTEHAGGTLTRAKGGVRVWTPGGR